ncbi:hypothetical protein CMV_020699 [Castanea mollissima]|uniref:Uncharacterized protein n=1 Tax=Castanea mollissima TaxID=60419 RepID=A0A8J4VDD0_9ROSI|nr:hypothetical protein CMV_020699 [Castanea mollissima]
MKTLLKTEKPLLLRRGTDSVKKTPLCVILLFPAQFVNEVFEKCSQLISGIVFGITGSIVMVLGDPVLVLAFVSIAYLIIFREEELQEYKLSLKEEGLTKPMFFLWTFPVIVDGPFGDVSATKLIGIFLFVVYVIWAVYAYTTQILSIISLVLFEFKTDCFLLEFLGLCFGSIGLHYTAWHFCFFRGQGDQFFAL